ncbi:MAG: CDP-alcohol phosphatidyltransferase family protein [Methanomethylophilus sp.]|nr:CDP-alcohol phosphatidyltransferase family protein [Methanomethylophilus sp.]WII08552.1 CDP-alcohol phosphatidyltransferase family protein [Methanomassiliicoccales archaeon LGM-DZ1]
MVLDKHRREADPFIAPVARRFINVNPNTVSWLGLITALICGVVFYFSYDEHWLLLLGAILVLVSGYFDALDGKIAKLAGKCSVKGDYLDHVFDRYADMFMIVPFALCGWCNDYIGMLAIVGVLLTSYMGTQAQAVGAKRLYDGLLGRADRVVLCFAVPIFQFIMSAVWEDTFDVFGHAMSLIELMMLYFAVVGNLTAVQRVLMTWRNLGEAERSAGQEGGEAGKKE